MAFASRFFGPRQPGKGRTTRRVAGVMNKTEARYEAEVLIPLTRSGEAIWYVFEGLTLKLGADLRYTPDFVVQRADGSIECHDAKAATKDGDPLIEDDARVKMIAAAERFPFKFTSNWFDKTKGVWCEKVY